MKTVAHLTLRLPPRALEPNRPCHWAAKARAVKAYRELAYLSALAFKPKRPYRAVNVQCVFIYAVERKRDKDNRLASMKAAFDGIADAGIVADDSGMTHLPPRMEVRRGAQPHVEIIVMAGRGA